MKVGDLIRLKMLPRKMHPKEKMIHTAIIIEKYQNPQGMWKFRVAWTKEKAIGDFSIKDAERLFEVISENKNE